MITQPRWITDCYLMNNNVPQFKPFSRKGTVGFRGKLEGHRTRRIYDVTVQASVHTYPELKPAIYISPHPEPYHWRGDDRRLCVEWDWRPNRYSFVDALLIAAKYLAEFD